MNRTIDSAVLSARRIAMYCLRPIATYCLLPIAVLASGCGGSTSALGGSEDGGTGPNNDAGGRCEVGDKSYPNGASGILAADGCNHCTCNHGQLECTLLACVAGKACGGFGGPACNAGEYCQTPVGMCDVADLPGQCTPVPDGCPEIYAPVCGCDGKTYENDCQAKRARASWARSGACETKPSSCLLDGVSYPDGTTGIPTGGCNTCSCTGGELICTRSACPAKACGARAGNTCTANEYCAYTDGELCGAADAESVCRPRPKSCDGNYEPVCGCDGITYANQCSASALGSGVLHTGPCSGSGKSCVVGGVTYPDGSNNIAASDGCNTCGCSDGVLSCSHRACPVPTICGGLTGKPCAADEFCAYVEGQTCGHADQTATCQKRGSGACPAVFEQVCGCDGRIYGNACEAGRAGTGVMSHDIRCDFQPEVGQVCRCTTQ